MSYSWSGVDLIIKKNKEDKADLCKNFVFCLFKMIEFFAPTDLEVQKETMLMFFLLMFFLVSNMTRVGLYHRNI